MAKVSVEIEIPDDCEVCGLPTMATATWEHAANEIPKHGRMGFSVRIREKWQWPSWLKVAAIAVDKCGDWWAFEKRPICDESSGQWRDGALWMLLSSELDFTPPPCDDWTKSLRINPNWKGEA